MQKLFSARNSLVLIICHVALLAFLLSSCGSTREMTYMQGKFDTARLNEIKIPDPIIRKGDLISIIVYSDNPAATAIYNQSVIANSASLGSTSSSNAGGGGTGSNTGTISSTTSPSSPGYLVDENGDLQFQGLGILHVEGLSKKQLKELLDSKLSKYLTNAYYTIRFLNYRFTMLGELTKPGIYSIPGEHVSLLEAIGLAGDLTFFGRRDNVLVMRENNGKREWARLDLTKPEILSSPYYYLQQNDVVYVEATKKKVVANDQVTVRTISIAATIASTLAILYSIFRK